MILFYTTKDDISANKICAELDRRVIEYKRLQVSDFVKSISLTHRLGRRNDASQIIVTEKGEKIDLSQISVIYARSLDDIKVEKAKEDLMLNNWMNMEVKNYFRETLEMLECPWFPCSPSVLHHLETEKFTELFAALDVDLVVPDTIVTNDYKLVLDFYRKHQGRIISKRYYTSKIRYKNLGVAFPTSPVSLRDIGFVRHVQYAPSLFQEYIPKKKELRITVVGEHTMAAEIDSQRTHHTRHDWRNYDKSRTPYKEHRLPGEIHDKLINLVKRRGLRYATCDMIITPQDEYVFLEINPAGLYSWIENTIGINITGMICDELTALSENYKAAKNQHKK